VHVRGDNTGIGAVSHADARFVKNEPAGLSCIVGCAEWFDGKVTDKKPLVIAAGVMQKGFFRRAAEVEEIGKGPLRSIYRNVQFPGQHIDAPYMVRMLVRYEKGIDPACIDAGPVHSQEAFFCAQAGIDEQRTAFSFNDNTIAFAAAGKDSTAHYL